MTPQDFERYIQRHGRQIVRLMHRELPVKAGALARSHFRENFRRGGFVDDTLKPWKPAKRIGRAKGAAGTYKTLLSARNHLYSSINYTTAPFRTTVYTNVHYADVHNEGLRAGRGRGFRMPQRQFIGPSRALDRKVFKLIEKEINKKLDK